MKIFTHHFPLIVAIMLIPFQGYMQIQNCGLDEGAGGILEDPSSMVVDIDGMSPEPILTDVTAGLPNTEYIFTNPNNIIPDPDSLISGPEIFYSNLTGQFIPEDLGLEVGDEYCLTAVSYDLEGFQSLLTTIFNDSVGIASCCTLTELSQMVDLCGNLVAVGIETGEDLTDFNGILTVVEAYEAYRAVEYVTFVIDSTLNLVSGFPCTSGLPACYAYSNTVCFTVDSLSTGIFDHQVNEDIQIYPNPASDFLIVDANKSVSSIESIELINNRGESIYHDDRTNIENGRLKMHFAGYVSGMYFLRIQYSDNSSSIHKFIISE